MIITNFWNLRRDWQDKRLRKYFISYDVSAIDNLHLKALLSENSLSDYVIWSIKYHLKISCYKWPLSLPCINVKFVAKISSKLLLKVQRDRVVVKFMTMGSAPSPITSLLLPTRFKFRTFYLPNPHRHFVSLIKCRTKRPMNSTVSLIVGFWVPINSWNKRNDFNYRPLFLWYLWF